MLLMRPVSDAVVHTTINTRGFFDATSNERRISHYIPSTKDLVVYSLQDPENPVVVDVDLKLTPDQKVVFQIPQDLWKKCSHPKSRWSCVLHRRPRREQRSPSSQRKGRCLTKTYCYDLKRGEMNQLNDMNFCRASHAVCLVDRFIYACAGSSDIEDGQKSFERYDIQQNLWDRMPDCNFPAIRCLMVPLHDRYIYKFGGISPDGAAFKDIEYYDIKEKEWIIISDPIVKAEPEVLKRLQFRFMAMMGGVQVNHNSILVFGGMDPNKNQSSQSFLFTRQESISPNGKPTHLIEHVQRQNLFLKLAFSHTQAITAGKKLFAFTDKLDAGSDLLTFSKRDLVVFDGDEWKIC